MIIGVDEVGRGPLAGPVTVAAFSAPQSMRGKLIKILGSKIKDSKKLSHVERTAINRSICELKQAGELDFKITHIQHSVIDRIGITNAVKFGIAKSLAKLDHKNLKYQGHPGTQLAVRLDGLLKAPGEYENQKTIIKGDEKDVFIACASIVAKVARDRLMARRARQYPLYAFEIHKGYGTKHHCSAIAQHGLSKIHRLTFCSRFLELT